MNFFVDDDFANEETETEEEDEEAEEQQQVEHEAHGMFWVVGYTVLLITDYDFKTASPKCIRKTYIFLELNWLISLKTRLKTLAELFR